MAPGPMTPVPPNKKRRSAFTAAASRIEATADLAGTSGTNQDQVSDPHNPHAPKRKRTPRAYMLERVQQAQQYREQASLAAQAGKREAEAAKEKERQEKEQAIAQYQARAGEALNRMKHTTFPWELVNQILQWAVGTRGSRLHLNGSVDVADLALHGFLAHANNSLAAEGELAILECATFELTPVFRRAGVRVDHVLPTMLEDRAHRIHHLVLTIKVNIEKHADLYPVRIYQLADGMESMASHLPRLTSCHLRVIFRFPDRSDGWSTMEKMTLHQRSCRKGFSKNSNVDTELRALFNKFAIHSPGKYKSLRLEYYCLATRDSVIGRVVPIKVAKLDKEDTSVSGNAEVAETPNRNLLEMARDPVRAIKAPLYEQSANGV